MSRVLYISIEFGKLHYAIVDALKTHIDVIPITYSLRKSPKNESEPSNCIKSIEYPFSVFKGPILYLHRLRYIYRKCYKIFKDEDITLIHGHIASCDGYICRLLSKQLGVPYVVSIRNTDLYLPFIWKIPWIKRSLIQTLIEAHAVVFINHPYQKVLFERIKNDSIKKALSRKCFFITNGIDDFWLSNINTNRNTISKRITVLTVGVIDKNKNQITIAKAINELIKEGWDIVYNIVGNCNDETIINELKLFDFISLYPFSEKEGLLEQYRKCDIFALASIHETFGLVYAEAMSQGCPIIYTRGQGFDGLFLEGEVGVSVNPISIEEIKEAIKKTVKNYDAMAKNAIQDCRAFSWEFVSQEIVNMYNQ